MTKLRILYARTLRMVLISSIILSVLGITLYFIDDHVLKQEEELTTLEQMTLQESGRLADLEQKYHMYESSFSAYQEIYAHLQKQHYDLSIPIARRTLEILRKQHRISNLVVEISPQRSYAQTEQNFVGFRPIYRKITLRCGAMTDLHLDIFVQKIIQLFPGRIHPVHVNFKRVRPFSQEILNDIAKGATPVVVEADMTFLWLGIEPLVTSTPSSGKGEGS